MATGRMSKKFYIHQRISAGFAQDNPGDSLPHFKTLEEWLEKNQLSSTLQPKLVKHLTSWDDSPLPTPIALWIGYPIWLAAVSPQPVPSSLSGSAHCDRAPRRPLARGLPHQASPSSIPYLVSVCCLPKGTHEQLLLWQQTRRGQRVGG